MAMLQKQQTPPEHFTHFGPHLMLDCRGCNAAKINDPAYIYKVLDELPTAIGMTKIIPPYVFPYEGKVPEDKGVTGMVIIAESHLTFHSFTEKDYFFFDIFSCKWFDVDVVVRYILDAFEVRDFEMHRADRGRYFPRSEDPVISELPAQRLSLTMMETPQPAVV